MAVHTPRANRSNDDDDDSQMTSFSDGDPDGDDSSDDDSDDDEDRGDEHEGSDDDNDDSDSDSDEDEDEDEDEGEESGDEQDDEQNLSLEDLQSIAAENGGMVPIARLNEVLERNKQLTDLVLQKYGTSSSQSDALAFDLKAKLKERNAKLLEGDEDAALALDEEIEDYRQQQADARAAQRIAESLEEQATQTAIASVLKAYPTLNDKNKDHDPEVLDTVVAMRNVLIGRGMSKAEAIAEAARRILGKQEPPTERRKSENRNASSVGDRLRNLQRARRSPPATHRIGAGQRAQGDLTETDIRKMSEGKFTSIDKRDKAELRGDYDVPGAKGKRNRA